MENNNIEQKFDESFDRIFANEDPICNICGKNLDTTKECAWTGCPLNFETNAMRYIGE